MLVTSWRLYQVRGYNIIATSYRVIHAVRMEIENRKQGLIYCKILLESSILSTRIWHIPKAYSFSTVINEPGKLNVAMTSKVL